MTPSSVFITHQLLSELLSNVLAKGSCCRFQSKGQSMSPFIKDGDMVTISPLMNSSISFGSIVAFICPKTRKLVIHRVVGKNGNHYLTKGDNAIEADNLVPRENIVGFVSRIERNCNELFLGLGIERLAIALLSRSKLLFFLLGSCRQMLRSIRNLM